MENSSLSKSTSGYLNDLPLFIVGHEGVHGEPYPFKSKIVNRMLRSGNRGTLQGLIKSWIQTHGFYYQFSSQLQQHRKVSVKSLVSLLEQISQKEKSGNMDNELKLLIVRNCHLNPIQKYLEKFSLSITIPSPVSFIKSLKRKYYLCSPNYSSSHIARVLSWAVSSIIRNICPHEFSKCGWMKSNSDKIAPNICLAIRFYNFLTLRIATEIVMTRDITLRAQNIERSIEIAYHASKLGNFELVSAIIAGLNSCSCSPDRLKKSWQVVSKKLFNVFEELENSVGPISNYQKYRDTTNELTQNNQPYVPVISVLLRDIVATGIDKQSDNITTEQLLVIGKIIWPIVRLQMEIPPCKQVQKNFKNYAGFFHKLISQSPGSENLLMRLSYKREAPRNLQLLGDDDYFSPISGSDQSSSSNIEKFSFEILPSTNNDNEELNTPSDSECYSENNYISSDNITTFWNSTLAKDPASWNQSEVQIVLESWGLPPDLCSRLTSYYLRNGSALLQFVPSEEIILQVQYRVLLNTKIGELLHNRIEKKNTKSKVSQDKIKKIPVSSWSINEVSNWLSNISCTEVIDIFEENDISGRRLLDLSAADLLEMGIEESSERKHILKEIKKVCTPKRKVSRLSRSTGFR